MIVKWAVKSFICNGITLNWNFQVAHWSVEIYLFMSRLDGFRNRVSLLTSIDTVSILFISSYRSYFALCSVGKDWSVLILQFSASWLDWECYLGGNRYCLYFMCTWQNSLLLWRPIWLVYSAPFQLSVDHHSLLIRLSIVIEVDTLSLNDILSALYGRGRLVAAI
jgi:hypothetical protein